MIVSQLLSNVFAVIFLFTPTDSIFYRSPALQEIHLKPVAGQFYILDDAENKIRITAMSDQNGILYWYRRVKTPVCLTGECKVIDIGLYWDCTGDFFGLSVYGEHLTKTDHSIFSEQDYDRLLNILNNDWSLLREYDFAELTNENTETGGQQADATSGATRKEISSEAVQDAVYTTYTIWHLAHKGVKEQLMALTVDELNHRSWTDKILENGEKKYIIFLLDLFAQSKLNQADKLTPLIMEGLESNDDPRLQNMALRSLPRLDINENEIQRKVAEIYFSVPEDLRLRILTALKNVNHVSVPLYTALEGDLHIENEWFAIKVLNLLKNASTHSQKVMDAARKLSESNNSHVKESSERFLESVRQRVPKKN